MRFWSGTTINKLEQNEIFVFGSNPEGRHGKGAAKSAMAFGAKYGKGHGLHGQSYALITKNLTEGYLDHSTGIQYAKAGFLSISKEQIESNIKQLYICAKENPEKDFLVTYQYDQWPNGTPKKSLNGYTSKEIIDMFFCDDIPKNIVFHESYKNIVENVMNNNTQDEKYTFFFSLASVFSNFHPSLFTVKNVQFISNEQFMMYCKAKLFKDDKNAEKILLVNNETIAKQFINKEISSEDIAKKHFKEWNKLMMKIKSIGRDVSPYNDEIWSKNRKKYVKYGAKEKFLQNNDMLEKLKETGKTKMVEASPYDKIWGIGLSAKDARNVPESKWPGLNLLGEVFDELKIEIFPEPNNGMKM